MATWGALVWHSLEDLMLLWGEGLGVAWPVDCVSGGLNAVMELAAFTSLLI